jgi:hypothetical protein
MSNLEWHFRQRDPGEAIIGGVEVPSLGDEYGTVGSVGYAKKPRAQSGTFYGFN